MKFRSYYRFRRKKVAATLKVFTKNLAIAQLTNFDRLNGMFIRITGF